VLNEKEAKMAGHTVWEFRIHGINAHVQYEPRLIATGPELGDVLGDVAAVGLGDRIYEVLRDDDRDVLYNPRRTTEGTTIRQDDGGNWFHLAITTPIALDNYGGTEYNEAFCWGTVNESAEVQILEVWSGGAPRAKLLDRALAIPPKTGGDFELLTVIAGECEDPVLISVWVEFKEGGEVTIGGAGVRFSTRALD
jgi:hypothetical protein